MIKVYSRADGRIKPATIDTDTFLSTNFDNVVWIDMISPSAAEIAAVETTLGLELPTRQETEEIEYSARYWEDDLSITINTYFLLKQDNNTYINETVSFTLCNQYLVSIRFSELRLFTEFSRKVILTPSAFRDGVYVLAGIIEQRVELDADILEALAKEIVSASRHNLKSIADRDSFLEYITSFEDMNMTIRENLIDKQRILSALLKSRRIPEDLRREFTTMIKDVNSLVMTANFNFERLDFLQDLFLNHLSVEQNKVIKIFTVMSVIFLPPTLIASIYGMNFRILPELEWQLGYPLAICLMVLSGVLPIYIFKKKGWF
ncbi:MAG: magnesium/cobalt transporter CorA [Geobacter sp.]|nr:magnesium/cobalt transporter CorA [Geobacter sp.]